AVELNEEQRLRTLKTGVLILAGLSAAAALPASRLPEYVPGEIPDPETACSMFVQPARRPGGACRTRNCPGKGQPLLICSPLCAAAASEANTSPYSAPEVPRVLSDTGGREASAMSPRPTTPTERPTSIPRRRHSAQTWIARRSLEHMSTTGSVDGASPSVSQSIPERSALIR